MDVLVIAVHPDDETLGAGGTLLKHKANGDKIHWLIVTSMHEDQGFSKEKIKKREIEIERVTAEYKFDSVHKMNFPTTLLDRLTDLELVGKISEVIKVIRPHTIYLPFQNDVHSDHRKVFNASYSCTKTFRYPFIKRVLMMEALSETEFAPALSHQTFAPNSYVDISEFMEKKLQIVQHYEGEIAAPPFSRSLETMNALAIYRGSVAGCRFAEAFMLLKELS